MSFWWFLVRGILLLAFPLPNQAVVDQTVQAITVPNDNSTDNSTSTVSTTSTTILTTLNEGDTTLAAVTQGNVSGSPNFNWATMPVSQPFWWIIGIIIVVIAGLLLLAMVLLLIGTTKNKRHFLTAWMVLFGFYVGLEIVGAIGSFMFLSLVGGVIGAIGCAVVITDVCVGTG